MAAEMFVRASGKFGEGAASVAAVARNATVEAAKAKVAAGVAKALSLARGASRQFAMARGAVGFVAGAAFLCHAKGRAFIHYLISPATPKTPHHKTQRAQGQKMEWTSARRRSTLEHRRVARAY